MEKKFGMATQHKMYEMYIEPFIEKPPVGKYDIFYDLAERAFRSGVGKDEMNLVRLYLEICEDMSMNPQLSLSLPELFSYILSDTEYEATYRINEAIRNSSFDNNKIRSELNMYTATVENYVRPFITPIYFNFHKKDFHNGGPKTLADYVYVSIGEKEKFLSKCFISEPKYKCLIEKLDIRIRHAGSAHEHWVVLDDDHIEMRLVVPATGNVRDRFILTRHELRSKLDDLEKLTWVLRAGFYIFLNNKDLKVTPSKPRTKNGVENLSVTFANSRGIDVITPFIWDENREQIEITILYLTPKKNTLAEIILPTGVFEVIFTSKEVSYKLLMLNMVKYISNFVDTNKFKKIKIHVRKDENEIAETIYQIENLNDINSENIPTLISGDNLSEDILIKQEGELTVPKGTKDYYLKHLKEEMPDINFS